MTVKIQAIKGMNDILPQQSYRWQWLEAKVAELMHRYGFKNIRTPIVEATQLFTRGLGEVTDIVEKEMYSFVDKLNNEQLSLRPENTAGIVRCVAEHSLLYDGGKRLYYMGPMFRHERPQRGRYRQFHQIGAEILGFPNPETDVELMLLAQQLWQELGLKDIRLELNSLGQPPERRQHRQALIAYFEAHKELLDTDAAKRLYSNPLRILDSKNPALRELITQAPKLIDYLGEESKAHLKTVQELLTANGVEWRFNPYLVRGLDYYNLTVFEFVTEQLGAQGTVCAGGRYDHLMAQIGAKPAPAVGWALGVERILELIKEQQLEIARPVVDAYAIIPEAAALTVALKFIYQLRQAGVAVQMHTSTTAGKFDSMKAQFKKADASMARFALVFGAAELAQNMLTVKALRDGQGQQQQLALDDIAAVCRLLATK